MIIGMIVDGRTQYRTRVQGMPKQIKDLFTKIIRTFLWEEETVPMIGVNTFKLPLEQSRRKVLDVKSRNEAIELMKIQWYLKLDNERPK